MNPTYLATARLFTEVAPIVVEDGVFAVKGDTAINLFLREMPRLSIDLDLVFPDHRPARTEALATINEALRSAKARLAKRGLRVQTVSAADMGETKLLVRSPFLRGAHFGFRSVAVGQVVLVEHHLGHCVRRTVQPARIIDDDRCRSMLIADRFLLDDHSWPQVDGHDGARPHIGASIRTRRRPERFADGEVFVPHSYRSIPSVSKPGRRFQSVSSHPRMTPLSPQIGHCHRMSVEPGCNSAMMSPRRRLRPGRRQHGTL